MDRKIILSVFKLDKHTETKVPQEMFDVIFKNESQLLGKRNGQEKCKDLTFPFARSPLKCVNIKNSKILLKPKGNLTQEKEIREISIYFEASKDIDWQPGDTIAVLPKNACEHVQELLRLLELESKADTLCSVIVSKLCTRKTAKVPTYIPIETTPREILRDCLNLKSVLKKTFLRSLAEYCSDSDEKNFLKGISSKEGSSYYNDFIIKSGVDLIEILKLCPTCKPPFGLIIEHMSRLLPRPYSIANSPLKHDEMHFIFSTLNVNPGVTTKMLQEQSCEANASLLIYMREINSFRYTEDNYEQNQILIAVGTAIAPFLGFLEHKQHLMNNKRENPGITWLFVGASTQQAVIHRDQLLIWQSQNVINKYTESLSRSAVGRFHYVQDALEDNAKELVSLLMKPETRMYLCADGAQISKSIESCVQNILSKELSIVEADAIKLIKEFKTDRKYIEDIWL